MSLTDRRSRTAPTQRSSHRPHRTALRAVLAAVVGIALLGLAACGSGSSSGSDASSGASEAVTVKHAFGSTEVTKTDRVVTWGGGGIADAMLAMGKVPVAMPKYTYAVDAQGLNPWTAAKLKEMGAKTPALITNGEEPPYDEIIKAEPDVILANYSGITKDQYDKLSKIAPTVAYPGDPWSTPWREVITTVGTVLGEESTAKEVVADVDEQVKEAADAHPEFQGKTIAAVATDPSNTVYVYTAKDARVEFLEDLGFTTAPSVTSLYNGDISFYYTLSNEKLDELTSDVLLEYLLDDATDKKFNGSAAVQTMAQTKAGTVAKVTGEDPIAAVSPPTALSLPYALDDFVTALSGAAKKVQS